MFKEARADGEITTEMLDEMIKNMLDFAFDGYEHIKIENTNICDFSNVCC